MISVIRKIRVPFSFSCKISDPFSSRFIGISDPFSFYFNINVLVCLHPFKM